MGDENELQAISNYDITFKEDTEKLAKLTSEFVLNFYPAYMHSNTDVQEMPKEKSLDILKSYHFYRIVECSIYDVDDKFEYFSSKLQKLFITAYAIQKPVCYGIVSNNDKTSLVIGVDPQNGNNEIQTVIEGLLPGIKLEKYEEGFTNNKDKQTGIEKTRYVGCLSGVPSLKIDGELQNKDLSSLMRSLNGMSYTIMILCKPISRNKVQEKINQAISVQDQCFAISKRTLGFQEGASNSTQSTITHTDSNSEGTTKQKGVSMSGALPLAAAGAAIGSVVPGIGTTIGAVGGGMIGLLVGKNITLNASNSKTKTHTVSDGYSNAVTETINSGKSITADIQNGFAIELMNMAEKQTERYKIGRNIGLWDMLVTYSTDSVLASKVIEGSLYSELATGISEVLPPVVFSYSSDENSNDNEHLHADHLMIPKGFFDEESESAVGSLVTSEELCGICTIPSENTVGFEIKESRDYPLSYYQNSLESTIGYVCEYDRVLKNIPFGLSENDLNKHTFVCGITGSGKTNTVKKILEASDKSFLVIEPAKKEYRNIKKDGLQVYTLGRAEINCLRINPFYILPGVSPQQHIDLLKDLFSASFALYGPMPYILEKCLHNIYMKKGWNLTLGFHPQLVSGLSTDQIFNADNFSKAYANNSHKYVFPTMQDLKDEVDYYIENELTYEGEVKGNIRGAIKSRIDSLCVGSKGYMFNTSENINLKNLLNVPSVIELEGLSDDADKAFSLGLLIININEYRQVDKETERGNGLRHLLVIEEAHRLLKNVSTENSSEDLGNPKGKAVEHFTNMLAEMRSYGQGVIVAEQIPSKLAPDVIKNSSNKIIHRIVAKDDQEIIANTIGVKAEDAMDLGNNKTGYALCHKEGMTQPVNVKIDSVSSNNIEDVKLFNNELKRKMDDINISIIKTGLYEKVSIYAVKTLLSLMYETDSNTVFRGISIAVDKIRQELKMKAIILVPGNESDPDICIKMCLYDKVMSLMTVGVFSTKNIVPESLANALRNNILVSDDNKLNTLKEELKRFYKKETKSKAVEVVGALLSNEYVNGVEITKAIQDYLLLPNVKFNSDVKEWYRKERA